MCHISTQRLLRSVSCFGLMFVSLSVMAVCPPAKLTQSALLELKAQSWQLDDASQRQTLAKNLLACLGDADPVLRDDIAFDALSFWMRNGLLDTATIQEMKSLLLQTVTTDFLKTQAGFAPAFAALVLAEIARVDRRTPFLSSQERQEMVSAASQFMRTTQDFRGFDAVQGWRHSVAHGADWMMQLSLNPALDSAQQSIMLEALATKIHTELHFYQYGESTRLMMPVLLLAMRTELTQADWQLWFERLLQSELVLAKTSQASLARQHNLNAFLLALYHQLQESKNDALREKLLPLARQALKKLG